MIKKFIYIFTAISGILAGVSSCSLDIPPADQYSDPDAITNVSTARSLLTSAYLLYPHYEYELSILGDDFCQTSITGKDMSQKNLYLWQDNSITSFAELSGWNIIIQLLLAILCLNGWIISYWRMLRRRVQKQL